MKRKLAISMTNDDFQNVCGKRTVEFEDYLHTFQVNGELFTVLATRAHYEITRTGKLRKLGTWLHGWDIWLVHKDRALPATKWYGGEPSVERLESTARPFRISMQNDRCFSQVMEQFDAVKA